MNLNCAGCGGSIADRYFMKCPKCEKSYDLLCGNIPKEDFNKLTKTNKEEWLCPGCKCSQPKGDNSMTPIRAAASVALPSKAQPKTCENVTMSRGSKQQAKAKSTKENLPTTIDMASLITELRQLKQEVSDVKQQNYEIKNQMTLISETLSATVKEHSNQLQKVEQNVIGLKMTIESLQQQLAVREQDSMRNDIEIMGVGEKDNENLSHIVMEASRKIGVNLTESDIDDVVRVGPKSMKLSKHSPQQHFPRPIIVKLVRKQKRDDLIKAVKARRNLTTENIVDGPPTNIFFNERLTKENRNLFRQARTRTSDYGFRYCWIKNGGIYVRKADGKSAARITSLLDLDEKVGQAKSPEGSTSEV